MDELASSFGYTWQDGGQSVLQLVSYTLFSGTIQPGTEQELILHLVNVAAIDKNLNLLIRIVNQEGQELFRSDQWPFGAATKDWALGDLWLDKQLIPIPADTPPGLYRVEISFYDPSTLDRLPALSSESGSPVGDTVVLDYLTVGPTTGPSSALDRVGIVPIEPAVLVGEAIELLGAKLLSPDLASQGVNGGEIREENGEAGSMPDSGADGVSYRAGDRINIRLVWRATNYGTEKLTSFVHLVGPDGVLAAQQDRPPLEGFISTALWSPALVVEDDYTIALPNELASGKYKLFVGMYDSQSQQRLPINQAGEPMVDAFNIWTIDISSE